MNHPVIIKGTKSGIIVHLKEELPFEELKEKVCEKFKSSADFLGDAQIALSFEGRKLSDEEQLELVDCITENSLKSSVSLTTTQSGRRISAVHWKKS